MQQEISSQARGEIDRSQREYFLRQQLRAIQQELGEGEELAEEIASYRRLVDEKEIPEEAREEIERQIRRLERSHPDSAETGVLRTYLDWLTGLPWEFDQRGRPRPRPRARKILDEDHYDLEKIKERILEYLAVRKLKADTRGADPLLRRPARRRQDLARPLDRPRHGAQVRAHLARRRARRGRDPRPPPHLRRRAARPHPPGHPPGRHRAIRSSCSTRSTRSAPTIAAIPRRRCSRCSIRSRTRASATTTSASPTTSRG